MKVKVNIPSNIKNYAKTSDYISKAFLGSVIKDSGKALSNAGANVSISGTKRMDATIGKLTNRGVIDLKPFFMRSPHAKKKKDGGWYMVIPISVKSKKIVSSSGNKVYQDIKRGFQSLGNEESSTLSFDGLFKKDYDSLADLTLPSLIPASPSGNITATKSSKGNRNSYVAFRTVSDKSSPQSWVIGRKNVNTSNSSQTLQSDVVNLIRNRIRQKGSQ